MKRILFLAVCLCTLFMTAVAANPIVGKWVQTENQQGVSVVSTYEFNDNGILLQTMQMTCQSPKMAIDGAGTCTYTYTDNTISFKFSGKDFNFSKFEIEGVPQATVDQMMEQTKASMVNMEQKLTDVKIEGNKLTAKFNGQTITLTRQ